MRTSKSSSSLFLFVVTVAASALVPALYAQRDAWLRADTTPIELPGGSRVEFSSMASEAIHQRASFSVFLPPSYGKGNERYPVVYFLHGLFNDHTSWTIDRHGNIPAKLDDAMARGAIPEMLLVHPDGGKSFYTNYRDGSVAYEDLIVEELPAYIEERYRVRAGAKHRAIAGTSMGGYGALKIAMRFPERYAAVAAHSPIVFPVDNPIDVPPERRAGRYYRYLRQIFTTVYGDPFDQAYYDAHNPLALAATAELGDLGIYFDYGTADRYNGSVGLGLGLHKLHHALEGRGVQHTFRELPNEPHGWALVFDHIHESAAFLGEHLE